MQPPKIVLCAVDLSTLAAREVAIASELCEVFGARLVLHHNVASVAPGLTRAWEWKEVHRDTRESATEVEAAMRALMSGVPKSVPVEASITSGALVPILLDLANRLPADLLVLGSHGWSSEEHASVAERVLQRATCPVISIHDGYAATAPIRMRAHPGHAAPEVVVAVDRTDASARVLRYGFDLARTLGLRLHLLHVEPAGATTQAHDEAHRRLVDSVPPDLMERVDCHLDSGDPSTRIMSFLHERLPAFVVMGEHARGFVGRYFAHDTARDVLHRAPCPVWFVPPG